jgi:hypothetical protein
MASVELLPGEVPRRSNFPRYPDQKSMEAAVRKTSSSSPESGSNMSEPLMSKMATNCPDETLRSALHKALGDRIDTISVMDLLKEIEVLAVVRQSNNVNTLAMISAKQERDEPVRQFTARL